jgi:hypothetical protein
VDLKAKDLEKEIPAILATVTSCKFMFLGARDLITRYRTPPKSTFVLPCANSITSGNARLALVRLSDYNSLIANEKGELLEYLFESNVRDYQGEVDVNKQIRDSLQNTADTAEFWWLNNGITILARKIGGHTTELTIDDPQIVNGLQTSMEIYEHFRQNKNSPSGARHAVVRIIESPEAELQDRIIKATNSQTKIPPQYLRATETLQRDIEQVFRASGMHYDRRKNSWRNLAIPIDKEVGDVRTSARNFSRRSSLAPAAAEERTASTPIVKAAKHGPEERPIGRARRSCPQITVQAGLNQASPAASCPRFGARHSSCGTSLC